MSANQARPELKAPCESIYLTVDEVSGLLRRSKKSVYRLVESEPTLPVLKLGGTLLFPRERLHCWLDQRTQGVRVLSQHVRASANGVSAKEPAHA